MKKQIAALLSAILLVVFTGGCSDSDGGIKRLSGDIRQTYMQAGAIESTVRIMCDTGNQVMDYQLLYQKEKDGDVYVTVNEPKAISGVVVKVCDNGTVLQFENLVLETGLPKYTGFTPLDAVPCMLLDVGQRVPTEISLESSKQGDYAVLTFEDYFSEKDASKTIWIDRKTLKPIKAEMYFEGRMILSCEFELFDFA